MAEVPTRWLPVTTVEQAQAIAEAMLISIRKDAIEIPARKAPPHRRGRLVLRQPILFTTDEDTSHIEVGAVGTVQFGPHTIECVVTQVDEPGRYWVGPIPSLDDEEAEQ